MKVMFLLSAVCAIAASSKCTYASDLRGRVVDEEGKPIVGARIDVATAAPKVGRGIFCPSCYLDCRKWTRSDDKGEFVIRDLSPKLKFRILSTATGKQTRLSKHFDPDSGELSLVLDRFPADTPPERILLGEVVTVEGVPIAGALVEPYGAKTREKRWWGPVEAQSAVTDDDGKFQMLLGADFQGVDLKVLADEMAGSQTQLLKPGKEVHRIVVPEGARVTGKLVRDGKPQPGMGVAVVQTNRSTDVLFIKAVSAVTDEQGNFHFWALPADQEYAIFSPVGQSDGEAHSDTRPIVTTKKFRVPEDGKTRELGSIEMTTGFNLTGKIVMTDGRAMPGDIKVLLGRDPAWDLVETAVDSDGQFEFRNIPTETYEVTILAKGFVVDASRSIRQPTQPNAIGVRLTKSTKVLIPLRNESSPESSPKVEEQPAQVPPSNPEPEPIADLPWVETAAIDRPKVEFTEEPVPDDAPKVSTRGIVRTIEGERIAGATVVLRAKLGGTFYHMGVQHNRDILARTTTDDQGQFVFDDIPIPIRMDRTISSLISGNGGAEVIAFSDGTGLSWQDIPQLTSRDPLQVTLDAEAECRGKIVDENGSPIADARVEVSGITSNRGHYDNFFSAPTDLNLVLTQVPRLVRTDETGQFAMSHLPRNRRSLLVVKANGFAREIAFLDSSDGAKTSKVTSSKQTKDSQIVVSPSPLTVVMKTQRTVMIQVVDHSGKPVDQGMVQAIDDQRHFAGSDDVSTSGEAFLPIQKPGRYKFRYASDPLAPHMSGRVELKIDASENELLVGTIQLPKFRWLTGRVLSKDTEQPAVGIMVSAAAIADEGESAGGSTAISGKNGEFRIPVVPGRVRCRFASSAAYGYFDFSSQEFARGPGSKDSNAVEVNVPKEGDIPSVTLKLSRGMIIDGIVVDTVGTPLPNVVVRAEQLDSPYRSMAAMADKQGRFRIVGLSPRVSTLVSATTSELGERVLLAPDEGAQSIELVRSDFRLVLKPGVQLAGRVLKDGKPVPGVTMKLSRTLPKGDSRYMPFSQAVTDRDGRYLIGGLEPGDGYRFTIDAPQAMSAPDWQYQSPYIRNVPEDQAGKLEIPDANLMTYGQSLGGKVVDVDGEPVAGYTVSAQGSRGMSLSRRENQPPPWMETDSDGKFLLESLPDQSLELMVYKANPAGGRIRNPMRVRPKMNDHDIRIVVDPTLDEGVESLDK